VYSGDLQATSSPLIGLEIQLRLIQVLLMDLSFIYINELEFCVSPLNTPHLYNHLLSKRMNTEITLIAVSWTHKPEVGIVIGELITVPSIMQFMMAFKNELIVTAFIRDSSKRIWRVKAKSGVAGQLLNYQLGQKIKLIGVKGNLCAGAWNNAKRQIVPSHIQLKKNS